MKCYPEVSFDAWETGNVSTRLVVSQLTPSSLAPKEVLDALQERVKGWESIARCRQFFDVFAKSKGFDPTDPENWYAVKKADILGVKVRILSPRKWLLLTR